MPGRGSDIVRHDLQCKVQSIDVNNKILETLCTVSPAALDQIYIQVVLSASSVSKL